VGASVRAVNPGTSREIAIIGAALDLGQGRRGVDMGPSAIRYAGLEERLQSLGYEVRDEGNVETAVAEATALRDERARFLPEVHDTCELVASRVAEATKRSALPLVLGGDHSVALGTLGGLASVHGPGGVLWIDAHSDINTPQSSPTGNVHGMALAAALGLAGEGFESEHWPLPSIDARRVALIGIRELDDGERRLLRETGVRVFTMSEIDRIGIERAVRESLDRISGAGFVHISLDMDALDPDIAPGVGTPVQGGLTYREAHLALELVAESGLAGSLEVVEVNPILDRENTTGLTAVELIASALGKTIY
jgi:arginase